MTNPIHTFPSRRWSWLGAAALLISASAAAQTGVAVNAPWGLEQAFNQAWQRQPEAAAEAVLRDAARAQRQAAGAWLAQAPALQVTAQSDRLHSNVGAREYQVELALPLWLPGERQRSGAAAERGEQAQAAQLQGARWRTAGAVRQAWWAWQRAVQEQLLARQRSSHAQALAADVDKRVRAGDLAPADGLQAQAALALALAEQADADAQQLQAWQPLSALSGQQQPPSLGDEIALEALPDMRKQLSEDEHPGLLELRLQAEAAQAQEALAALQTRGNPELTLATTRARDGFGQGAAGSITLGLRIPLGEGARAQAKRLQAQAQAVQAHSQWQLQLHNQRQALQLARQQWQLAQQRLQASTERAALTAQVRQAYEQSFRLGESDWPTRQRVELEAEQAQRQALRARMDAAAAVSELRQALGLWP